jgi:hypothetical protein
MVMVSVWSGRWERGFIPHRLEGVRNLFCLRRASLGRFPMDFLRVNIDVLLLYCVANHSLFCGDTRAWRGQPGQEESAFRASVTAGGGPERRKVSARALGLRHGGTTGSGSVRSLTMRTFPNPGFSA